MKYLFIAGLSLILVNLASCKKDKSEPTLSRTDLISTGTWIRKIKTTEHNGTIESSMYDSYPNCIKDNEFIFRKDSTHTIREGKTKCDPGYPDEVDKGIWMFKNEEKYLRIYWHSGSGLEYEITKLTKDSMILQLSSAGYIYKDYFSH